MVIYSLTDKGSSLRALMDEMLNWGFNNLMDENCKREIQEFILSL